MAEDIHLDVFCPRKFVCPFCKLYLADKPFFGTENRYPVPGTVLFRQTDVHQASAVLRPEPFQLAGVLVAEAAALFADDAALVTPRKPWRHVVLWQHLLCFLWCLRRLNALYRSRIAWLSLAGVRGW